MGFLVQHLVSMLLVALLVYNASSQENGEASPTKPTIPSIPFESNVGNELEQKCAAVYAECVQQKEPTTTESEITTTVMPDATTVGTTPESEGTTLELEATTGASTIMPQDDPLETTTSDMKTEEPQDSTTTSSVPEDVDDKSTSAEPPTSDSPTSESPTSEPPTSESESESSDSSSSESPMTTEAGTTMEPNEEIQPRQGKQLDPPESNSLKDSLPADSSAALLKLIENLTKKIEDLEATQRKLYDTIADLQEKLENTPQMRKQKEATSDLVSGDPDNAAEKWRDLSENVVSPDELGNITSNICSEALDQGAPPTSVMEFANKLPTPEVQEPAYNSIADKVNGSEQIQEQMYWREMTPYCQQAARNIGPNNPATVNMYRAQNQVRLNAARPIAESCRNIQRQKYQPAVYSWLNMVRDIPDSPPQLETNMKRMMLRTYDGKATNLPYAFHFILILPPNQGFFKQVAYKCLTQEMKANGHYYNPNMAQGGSPPNPGGRQQRSSSG